MKFLILILLLFNFGCSKSKQSVRKDIQKKLICHEVVMIESVHGSIANAIERGNAPDARFSSDFSRVLLSKSYESVPSHFFILFSENDFKHLYNITDPLGWQEYFKNGYVVSYNNMGVASIIRNNDDGGVRIGDSLVIDEKYSKYFSSITSYELLGEHLWAEFEDLSKTWYRTGTVH